MQAPMLHLPTLLFALVLTDLVLAASLYVAIAPGARRGVGAWSASLVLQGLAFVSLALRGVVPESPSNVWLNASSGLAFMLQVAAVREFEGRRFSRKWLVFTPIVLGGAFWLVAGEPRVRVAMGGLTYGAALLWLAGEARSLAQDERWLGRRLLVWGATTGGVMFGARALIAMLRPEVYQGFHGEGLLPVVSTLVGHAMTMMQSLGFLLLHRERQEREMERLAMTDALTGAYNRRMLFELGEKELGRARREGTGLSVAMLDLDAFKAINDQHGHHAGDAVLKRFAEVVRECLRGSDTLARYGGEEFCVLIPGTSPSAATAVSERIRAAVEASSFVTGGQPIPVTASVGVVSLATAPDADFPALLRRADEALYRAKREGRNRVVLAA